MPREVSITEGDVTEICVEYMLPIPAERAIMLSISESSSMSLS